MKCGGMMSTFNRLKRQQTMMVVQENDRCVIPEKYRKMSVAEIEQEKKRVLDEIKSKPVVPPNRPRTERKAGMINSDLMHLGISKRYARRKNRQSP